MNDTVEMKDGLPQLDRVQKMTVQEIWDRWVNDGVDPDEEHVAVEVVMEGELIMKVLGRGNLMECLVAVSYSKGTTRIYKANEFAENAQELH